MGWESRKSSTHRYLVFYRRSLGEKRRSYIGRGQIAEFVDADFRTQRETIRKQRQAEFALKQPLAALDSAAAKLTGSVMLLTQLCLRRYGLDYSNHQWRVSKSRPRTSDEVRIVRCREEYDAAICSLQPSLHAVGASGWFAGVIGSCPDGTNIHRNREPEVLLEHAMVVIATLVQHGALLVANSDACSVPFQRQLFRREVLLSRQLDRLAKRLDLWHRMSSRRVKRSRTETRAIKWGQ